MSEEEQKHLQQSYYNLHEKYYKQKVEIERLNNKVEELMTLYTTERYVKEDYKAIIKEVREHIEQDIKTNYFKRYDDEVYKLCDELLEILDKAGKE